MWYSVINRYASCISYRGLPLLVITALLFWFFGGFRCGIPLLIVMLVVY